ncbi:MAG: hypothetical protein ACI4YB_08505 [Oscillospiraceae bacterium]
MDEIKNSSIAINLNEGNIVISGSEEFVEKNMETVFSFVERIKGKFFTSKTPSTLLEKTNEKNTDDEPIIPVQNSAKEKYKRLGIYSVDEEDNAISIHRKIPGKTNAEKMKNVAFIVLYEKQEAIESSMIKTLCQKQGCWDPKNFASIFERDIVNFIKKKKSKQKWTLELTIDGEAAAVELLEAMANDKK